MPENFSRVVLVHTSDHVHTALEAAQDAGQPVVLQTAPGATAYAGSLYLLNMFRQERKYFPDVTATLVLDCAEHTADAITAMQQGHTHIRASADDSILAKLADIAAQLKVTLVAAPYESLDLLDVRDAKTSCRKWLVE